MIVRIFHMSSGAGKVNNWLPAVALAVLSPCSLAADVVLPRGPYAGAGLVTGQARVAGSREDSLLFRPIVGYHFTVPVAIEASMLVGERFNFREHGTPVWGALTTRAATVQGVAHVDYGGPWQMIGTLGAVAWDTNLKGYDGAAKYAASDSGVGLMFGAGFSAYVGGRHWLRAMYERADIGEQSLNLLTFSYTASF